MGALENNTTADSQNPVLQTMADGRAWAASRPITETMADARA